MYSWSISDYKGRTYIGSCFPLAAFIEDRVDDDLSVKDDREVVYNRLVFVASLS